MTQDTLPNPARTDMRNQLKALSNRYAVEILSVLNPSTGEIIPHLGWEDIIEAIVQMEGLGRRSNAEEGERTPEEARAEEAYRKVGSGGTIYETMNRLIEVGYVTATGPRARKQRKFMITRQGRLALRAVQGLAGEIEADTEVQRSARVLLRHKNYISLLPAQAKFLREVGSVDGNLILQMPPGSGKTFLAMIVILLRLKVGQRCLYVTPYTSLNRQIVEEYGDLLGELGYVVVRHDGQSRASEKELEKADLVISVFESVLSALLQNRPWTEGIGLAVIDELTELDSATAGITARNLAADRSSRLDLLISILKGRAQLLTLSSRFGETEEVAEWLGALVFRPSVRLSPDEFIVTRQKGYVQIVSSDRTQRDRVTADDPIEAVLKHLGDYASKSVLLVVGSRVLAEEYAERLMRSHPRDIDSSTVAQVIGTTSGRSATERLERTLAKGIAFHHSGLSAGVRERLEGSIKARRVKTVVSTTGITSGMSLPFDCVIVIFDRKLFYIGTRARYLQIAGRIGEYHLAEHGGRVYLVYAEKTNQFPNPETLEGELLHRPLQPLRPKLIAPALAADLIMRDAVRRRNLTRAGLEKDFLSVTRESFRGITEEEHEEEMRGLFNHLFKWLVNEGAFTRKGGIIRVERKTRAAIRAGLGVVEYLNNRDMLDTLDPRVSDAEIIDLLLGFRLPQSMRPGTFVPSRMEIDAIGIPPPEKWYLELVDQRNEVKRCILRNWIDERDIEELILEGRRIADEITVDGRSYGGVYIDEGDLEAFVGICSNLAADLGRFMASTGRRGLSRVFDRFAMRLRHGVREDLAESDLMQLDIPGKEAPPRHLSREDARTLYDRGYVSIADIVHREVDPEKRGLARNRFARKCGLDPEYGRAVFKAAMAYLRRQRSR